MVETENRTQKSTRNIILGIIKNIVITLLAFISRKLFIVYIGVGYLGINGLFSNILSLLSMADLGLGTAMSFSFYKPLVEGDNDKLAALIHFYKKLYLFIFRQIKHLGQIICKASLREAYLKIIYLSNINVNKWI